MILREIQQSIVKIIKSDPYFVKVPVIPMTAHDLRTQFQTNMAKLGICILVQTASFENEGVDANAILMKPVKVNIDINEFVLANRSGGGSQLPCEDVVEQAALLLHSPAHAERNDPFPLICIRGHTIPDKQFFIYRVEFETSGAIAEKT
jgi:hypothetical protein